MRVPTRKSEQDRIALQGDGDQHLTPQAIERLKGQVENLEKVERPSAKLELQRAQEMGDLSENFGYQEAKRRLRNINDRITSIQDRLARAIPIQKGSMDGKIGIGSTVVVEANGRKMTFEILGSQETDPSRGRISHSSPLGSLLIGKSVDETVELKTPSSTITYRILQVR